MGFVRLGTGRDAADVSYATIFGSVTSPPPLISVSAITEAGRPWELPRHRPEATVDRRYGEQRLTSDAQIQPLKPRFIKSRRNILGKRRTTGNARRRE
jgi:hypothetical protein